MSLDAFGRLRVSDNFGTFNYYPTPNSTVANSGLDEDSWVNIEEGTGDATYNTNNYINMEVSASGDSVTRHTKLPMLYTPGKSRLMYMTSVLLSTSTSGVAGNITSRMGLINVDSSTPTTITAGTYIETDGAYLYLVNTTLLSPTTSSKLQSEWNIDTFTPGSLNPSGKTLTIANANTVMLFAIDQEWLGVGRVSGFLTDKALDSFTSNDYETLLKRTTASSYDTLYLTGSSDKANSDMYG